MQILTILGRYVFWCFDGICQEDFTFIQIGSGHTLNFSKLQSVFKKKKGNWAKMRTLWKTIFLYAKVTCISILLLYFSKFNVSQKKIHKTSFLDQYLVQLIKHPILRIPNFNFPNLVRCCKVFFSFWYNELYWHFWVYFDIDLKLLSGKNTQKVNKQNIRDS